MSKHQHNFLASDHSSSERKTWFVIILCGASMILEIGCGIRYGSLALIADGLHMSTHAFAFLITAVSYSYARKHADDQRFVFGTGKVGDLAAFTSAIILFLIALVILYEGLYRYFHPQQIRYREAIPIAFIGLAVNVVSGMILGDCFNCGSKAEHDGDGHGHSHGHTVQHFDYDIESSGKAHGKSGEAIDYHNNSHSSREHEHGQHIMGHGHEEHGTIDHYLRLLS